MRRESVLNAFLMPLAGLWLSSTVVAQDTEPAAGSVEAIASADPAMALSMPMDESTRRGISTTWNAHDRALSEHDIDAVLATWADGEASVLLGTGPGERWVGKAEIRTAYENFFGDFDRDTLRTECGWFVVGVRGDTAWGLAECDHFDAVKEVQRTFPVNVSVVLILQDGAWRFRALHFSNLTGGE